MNDDKEVYIIHQSGAVTIIDEQYAEKAIRQARSGGHKIKVFRDRQGYLDYLEEMDTEFEQMKLAMSYGI